LPPAKAEETRWIKVGGLARCACPMVSLGRSSWQGATPMINAVISMGVIDEKTFTRECIIRCLRTLDDRLRIESFATCDECLQTAEGQDLVLYYLREDISQCDKNKLISFRKLLSIVPVIILSDTENQNSLAQMFESGVRGLIPTDNAAPEQIIEIIKIVCLGK
jgi:DNA-binding NarL/FixJ family response regulator